MSVLIVTSLGDIVLDLYTDKCPLTSKNFLKLCKIKYYNGCLFHTVQKDFTAQTGDQTGTGTGGDSVYKFLYGHQARFFSDEIHLDLKHSKTGTVAMASGGENLNASQFYFTLRDDLDYLDGKHTVFGEVAEGFETLSRINEAYVDEKNRPFKNIRIKHTYILDDPFDDPPQLAELIPDASPEGKPKDEVDDDVRLEDDWVPMDQQLGTAELEEVLRAKDAHSSAVVLESVGDIPDAEIKPPENVLFVCKLNPVTEDEDLHTIFSRFGTVISAEVIRDFKTGDSLCYAFIEFETAEACQQAYFKMDNALIDDRRIHVDFSQSVSKLWSQYRRKDNQMSKGRGCFKCGALDHIAKDCTGGSATNQPSKYILKDDNTQRGGDNNYEMVFDGDVSESPRREKQHRGWDPDDRVEKRKMNMLSPLDNTQRGGDNNYEMVFDGDVSESPRREKQHRGRDLDDRVEKQKTNMLSPHDLKNGDQQKKYLSDRHRHSDKWNTEDGMNQDRKASRSGGSRRDQDYLEERRDREKHMERRRERDDNRRDERDYRKRRADIDGHGDRRYDGGYRKRSADAGIHGDRRDDRDYGKRNADSDRGDSRNEPSYRKSCVDNDSYKGRREEQEPRRSCRSAESDDDHGHDRRHRHDRKR